MHTCEAIEVLSRLSSSVRAQQLREYSIIPFTFARHVTLLKRQRGLFVYFGRTTGNRFCEAPTAVVGPRVKW